MSTAPVRYCVIEMRSDRLADLIATLGLGGFELKALPEHKLPSPLRADYEIVDDKVELSHEG